MLHMFGHVQAFFHIRSGIKTIFTFDYSRRRPTPVKSELVPYYWQPLASHVVLRYLNIDEELRMEKMLNIEQRYSFKKTCRQVYY